VDVDALSGLHDHLGLDYDVEIIEAHHKQMKGVVYAMSDVLA